MIAYRYVNIPGHLTRGAVVSKDTVRPAFFVTPTQAKIIAVHETTRLTIAKIQKVVADYYGISTEHMCGKSRDRNHAWPRQMAMTLSREILGSSLAMIGGRFGRDHTTVLHAIERVKERIANDANTEAEYATLKAKIAA